MNELLTTKQMQDHFQVDRTTIYRMLKDGRLHGIKIGNQWRFPQSKISVLTTPSLQTEPQSAIELLPVSCLQAVQDVSAESIEVGAIITDNNGVPLTRMSNSCRFCTLIRSTESGRQACINSWRELSMQQENSPQLATCHAGFQYMQAHIKINDAPTAMFVAGQINTQLSDVESLQTRANRLAQKHGLNASELLDTLREMPQIAPRRKEKISAWIKKLANTLTLITHERLDMLERLQRIAAMSAIAAKS